MTDNEMLDAIDSKICWCLDELTDRLAGVEVTEQIVHLSTSIREMMAARKIFVELCRGMKSTLICPSPFEDIDPLDRRPEV